MNTSRSDFDQEGWRKRSSEAPSPSLTKTWPTSLPLSQNYTTGISLFKIYLQACSFLSATWVWSSKREAYAYLNFTDEYVFC